jgi:hypothetical protein
MAGPALKLCFFIGCANFSGAKIVFLGGARLEKMEVLWLFLRWENCVVVGLGLTLGKKGLFLKKTGRDDA